MIKRFQYQIGLALYLALSMFQNYLSCRICQIRDDKRKRQLSPHFQSPCWILFACVDSCFFICSLLPSVYCLVFIFPFDVLFQKSNNWSILYLTNQIVTAETNFTKHRVFYASVRITWCAQPLIDFVIVFQFELGNKEGKHHHSCHF